MVARRSRRGAATDASTPPPILFKTPVPSEESRPGDLVSYFTDRGYRLGCVVAAKKVPRGHAAVCLKLPKGRLGPVRMVPFGSILHAYRDVEIEDPTDALDYALEDV